MKKLINSPDAVVQDALAGMAAAHAALLRVQFDPTYVLRVDAPVQGKVALVSGGGSGHEPLHAGFVGRGMLDAACPGHVFTSPEPGQMLAAAQAVHGGAGVLYIVKNYQGDVLNFELAQEFAEAEGLRVAAVTTNDDVAVRAAPMGGRGMGVTLLLEKIVGAAAEAGASLEECVRLGTQVNQQGRSMGVALTSCTVPAVGKPTFTLGENEMEVGIGIHGEAGRRRAPIAPAAEVAELLLGPILEDLPFHRGDSVLAFVNGMGGTPLMELYILYNEVARILAGRGIAIGRSLVGSYVTSLEMAGAAISLLRLDAELVRLWDAPVHTPALRWGC